MLIFCHAGEFSRGRFSLRENEFQSSDCLQHTAMMLVYGSSLFGLLQEALCKALCSLHSKMTLQATGPWTGQVTQQS